MSALAEQHERWSGARERLWHRPVERRALPRPMPLPELAPVVIVEEEAPHYAPFNFLKTPGAKAIIKLMALKHHLTAREIVGRGRSAKIVRVRDETILLVHTHCPQMTLPEMGRLFGDRDHTTILHSLWKMTGHKGRCQ